MTRVVNMKREPYDVRIDRKTKWGNPFHMGVRLDSRQQVIEQYEAYIRRRPDLLDALPELVGKRLGCHCAPLPCHGDVLVALIKERGLE